MADKWYNEPTFDSEKDSLVTAVKQYIKKKYSDVTVSDDIIEKTVYNYFDMSYRLGKSYTGMDRREWNANFGPLYDIWVTVMYAVYKGFPADMPVEEMRAKLKASTNIWEREEIIIVLDSILAVAKGNPTYNKFYEPFTRSASQSTAKQPGAVKIDNQSSATSTATSAPAFKLSPVVLGIGALAAAGLIYFVMKKKR